MKRIVLGLVGYIGSGKSLAGKYFEKRGAQFIDADEVVNELYKPQREGWLKIVNFFGREFLLKNGQINRKKLAKFVFPDRNKLKILNFLIHPLVTNEIGKILDKSDAQLIVIEAAYFEKKHLLKFTDQILWIECVKHVLRRRSLKSGRLSERMFEQIIASQVKPEKIDYVVENNGSKAEFYGKLKQVWHELRSQVFSSNIRV